MNKIAVSIRNRLSLRRPQEVSLNILADLADKLTLQKNADLTGELEKVKSAYPICTDFERNFSLPLFRAGNRRRQDPADGRLHHLSLSHEGDEAFLRSGAQSHDL